MNKHSVKFVRGSKTIWDQLNTTPEKIDNNTLYFIYEDENYSVGKLYLGQRLITDDKIINIKDIGDIQIDDESLIDKQILIYNEENQEWKNSSLEEIIDLSNYYTKNEVDNIVSTISTLSFQIVETLPTTDIKTDIIYLVPKGESEQSNVYEEWFYINGEWELLGTTDIDISGKMDLAPVNPSNAQIANLLQGQVYIPSESEYGLGVKTSSSYKLCLSPKSLSAYKKIVYSQNKPYPEGTIGSDNDGYVTGQLWCCSDGTLYVLTDYHNSASTYYYTRYYTWTPISRKFTISNSAPPTRVRSNGTTLPPYENGSLWIKTKGDAGSEQFDSAYFCISSEYSLARGEWFVVWIDITQNFYTKAEIDTAFIAKENTSNKVTSLSAQSTDTQYPSAKCMYDFVIDQIGDVSTKMDLAPLNPTAEQIDALPSGQLYGDTVNHKGVIKGGQEFYDTVYVDNNYRKTIINSQFRPPCNTQNNQTDYKVGDIWITTKANSVRLYKLAQTTYSGYNGYTHYWVAETPTCHYISRSASLPTQSQPKWVNYGSYDYYYEQPQYSMGDYICRQDSNMQTIALYICVSAKIQRSGTSCVVNYVWEEVNIPYNTYTKTEIDSMIGDIGTAIDTLNNNLAEV